MGPHRGRAPGRTVTYQLLRPYPTSASGRVPPQRAADKLTLLVCRWGQLAVLDQLVVVILDVVDDPQDLDEAEGGSQPPQGRLLLGVDVGHGPIRLPPWRLVAAGPEMQVDAAALELELVDLAFAVVLAAGLEREQFGISRELLQLGQQFSHRHAVRVARRAQLGMRVKLEVALP